MSLPVFKRPQVERDIEEAFVFIGEGDFDTGLDFLFAVEQTLEMIGQNPFIGSEREFVSPELKGVRMWRVKTYEKHLIFYRVHIRQYRSIACHSQRTGLQSNPRRAKIKGL